MFLVVSRPGPVHQTGGRFAPESDPGDVYFPPSVHRYACSMGLKGLQAVFALLTCCLWVTEGEAQEITPRLFWPAPKGTTVLVAGYAYSTGEVLLDPSIPIEGAEADVNTGVLAYMQTLGLWGRTSNLLLSLPYSRGTAQGFLGDRPESTDFSDFGDLSVTLNVNLSGAPTMNRAEFLAFRANPRPLVGASLKLIAPTGHYDPDRLINVGANRWTARLKLGAVLILNPSWVLEFSASGWFFGDDPDFINGRKEQDPLFTLESNLIKRIRPGLWASLDVTYYRGGQQSIAGAALNDARKNLKVGGTLVIPFLERHAIKIGYANGVIVRFGDDFNEVLLSYQVAIR